MRSREERSDELGKRSIHFRRYEILTRKHQSSCRHRPPQPPCYFFVIDVSGAAARAQSLESISSSIKANLDHLTSNPRAMVGFLTFDKVRGEQAERSENAQATR